MYYFYVLYSLKDNKLYKGFSENASARLIRHNAGGSTSTRNRRPLVLIYLEQFTTKQEAMARERWSKTLEGGSELKEILISKGILDSESKLRKEISGYERSIHNVKIARTGSRYERPSINYRGSFSLMMYHELDGSPCSSIQTTSSCQCGYILYLFLSLPSR